MKSRKFADAARLALQSATAAAGQFVLMQSFAMPEKFVGVLSAVLVVQPTVGHTLGASMDRIVATLLGSGLGLLCLVLLPGGYGTAVALGVCMLAMNFLAGFFPQWRYGVVAAVALALGSEDNSLQTALDRSVSIGLGAVLGTVVTLIVWPEKAIQRARRHLRLALAAIADRLDTAIDNARRVEQVDADGARRQFHSEMKSARDAADGIRINDQDAMRDRIGKVERLYNSVLMLNRVADETDDATEGNRQLSQSVETIRRCAQAVITSFADGATVTGDEFETIQRALENARRATYEDDSDPQDNVRRNALVFGLGEVAISLQALHDDPSEPHAARAAGVRS